MVYNLKSIFSDMRILSKYFYIELSIIIQLYYIYIYFYKYNIHEYKYLINTFQFFLLTFLTVRFYYL